MLLLSLLKLLNNYATYWLKYSFQSCIIVVAMDYFSPILAGVMGVKCGGAGGGAGTFPDL